MIQHSKKKSHSNLFKDFFSSFKFPCMLLYVRLSEQNICFHPHVQTRVGLYYSSIIYYVVILLVGITRYSDGVLRLTVCAVWTLWSLRCTDNTDNIVSNRSPVGCYPQWLNGLCYQEMKNRKNSYLLWTVTEKLPFILARAGMYTLNAVVVTRKL